MLLGLLPLPAHANLTLPRHPAEWTASDRAILQRGLRRRRRRQSNTGAAGILWRFTGREHVAMALIGGIITAYGLWLLARALLRWADQALYRHLFGRFRR
jgi:hypothetical protein